MKKKNSLILDDEFFEYCELNQIKNPEQLAKKLFNLGFSIEKYGETPTGVRSKEKIVEKEVIKEVIKEVKVEVPVEKIVEKIIEIEVIKEVPVEVIKEIPIQVKGDTQIITKEIIKEIPVEKIVFDREREQKKDLEIEELKKENQKLQSELTKLTTAMEKFNKAKYHKSSNISNLYDE